MAFCYLIEELPAWKEDASSYDEAEKSYNRSYV